ncbi:MAG: hypothetical protein AAF514_01970 [Verrucomicrobiota bacterium]
MNYRLSPTFNLAVFFSLGWSVLLTGAPPEVPRDLLADDHVREEFGVNQFTTPSIEKIFEDLAALGDLSFGKVRRPIPEHPGRQRALVALNLGMLIADGFLAVQCEKTNDLEAIGRAFFSHAKLLGVGERMNRHTKSLLDYSVAEKWDLLKAELVATQADVEAEMVSIRDGDIAHLLSLGGWLRALQIATAATEKDFSPEKAARITRRDLADYYLAQLATLEEDLLSEEVKKHLTRELERIRASFDPPDGVVDSALIARIGQQVGALLEKIVPSQEKKKEAKP